MRKLVSATLTAALFTFSLTAGAAIITFDTVAPGTNYVFLHEENGFRFSATGGFVAASSSIPDWYFGSQSMAIRNDNQYAELTKIGGGTFSFNSINLAPIAWSAGPGATVTFTGNIHGGGTVSASYTVNENAFQAFVLTGFDNLDSVTWQQNAPWHQFDNLVLDAPAQIPEPTSLALSGLALAAMGALRGRKP